MKIKLMQPSSYASAVLAVALAASLATSQRASAQVCDPCPANAQDTAIGVAFGVFVTRGGIDVNVSSGKVGECEVVKLKANVSYNAFGISGGVGAGFQGGTGLYILPGSIPVNVTPVDMATTKVGPPPCGTVPVKPMTDLSYILTAADKAAGIATFTFTYTNGISLLPNAQGQCVLRVQASPQQSVAIVRTPTCSILPPTTTVCEGVSATFTATGTGPADGQPWTFVWRGPGGFTQTNSGVTSSTITVSVAGTYTNTLIDAFGCSSSCTATLVVNPNPTCTITGPDPVCEGTTNVYTSAVLPAGGTVTHSWSITGNGTILGSTTGASISVRATAAGNFTVTDNVTRDGCPGVCNKTVVVNPNPTCTITGPDPVCDGTTNVYTSAVLPAGGTVTHSWSITGNGTILGSTTGASISVRATGAGNFTVTDNVTRDGCPGVCSKTVVVNPNPTCTITGPDPVCDGTTNVYTSAVLPAGGTVTHSWSITGNGTILGSTTGASISVRATGAGNFTVTDNVTRDGCPGVCSKTVVVNPNPTCTITGPDPVCDGTTNVYTSAVLPAGGTVTHSWSITGNGTILGSTTGASISVRATGAGNFTVTDNVTRNGCPGVCSKTVVVNPNPTCTITGPDPVCDGTTNVYTSAVLPAGGTVTHSWSITGSGTILGSTTGASISVRATGAGNFTVTDNVTRDGCPGVCSKTVVVNPNPTCTITGPDPVCDGTTNVYTSAVLPAGGTVTHSWSITGNGTILGSTTGASISVRATGAGNFTVTDNVTRDGCPGVCSKTVVVNPNPTCTITGPDPVCDGTTNVYTSAVLPAGGTVTHSWSITGNGTILGSTTGASISVRATGAGNFTVTDNVTRDGCPGVCSKTVVVNPNPTCTITGPDPVCAGSTNVYTSAVLPAGGTVTHSWSVTGNGTILGSATGASVTVRATGAGNFTVTDNVTRDGCPGVCAKTVVVIPCQPKICVTKEVVCELPGGCAANWSKLAIGAVSGGDCPSFCYRITVLNCGDDALSNVTVTDTNLNGYLTNCTFPTTLAIGESYTCIIPGVVECDDDGGTVVACGIGVLSGISVCTNDAAGVEVREISLTCEATVNGEPFIQIPCDGQPHLVTNAVRICNTGDLPLSNIRIFAPHLVALGGACANIPNIQISLDPGQCTNVELCVDAPVCPTDCSIAFSNYVQISGSVDLSKTNVCVYTRNATNGLDLISTSTECEAVVGCVAPNACRVTGGGRQDDPIVYPANVRYVTHGGQVGAPVGNRVCEVTDDFYLGNPCIHGRWTHVRHQKGGLRGNFHARYYDTLECACLDTNIVDGFYAAGTSDGEVCGNRNIGPLPRKAPANKIVFTGVGDWADPNGRRAPRATLFRVDIEDRGEPGNAHALDRNGKEGRVPDRYRIRIWVLTNQELALLRGSGTGSEKYLKGFRNAISACNGMTAPDGAVNGAGARVSIVNGTAVFGVRAPDIDDGGEMLHGNHQIHPAIKNCDPFNPTGPGLPPHGN